MKTYSAASVVIASVTMLLCGILNAALNILQRFSHFMDTVRTAAEFNTDLTSVSDWADIAVSVYDIYVIFNLSSGILAAVQIISGISALICVIIDTYGKNKIKFHILPLFFGIVCVIFGIISTISLIVLHSAGVFITLLLVLTKLFVPIIFLRTIIIQNRNINRGDTQ